MEQQPYEPQPRDLERKLTELFPNDGLRNAARAALSRYGRQNWHAEIDRVRLAILKLAGGDLTAIDKGVDAADVDYRDTLASAEYPAYSLLRPGIDPLEPEAQSAIESDRRQYLEWIGS